MSLSKSSKPVNHLENKETIVTNLALTTAMGLNIFLRDKLPLWMENRKRVKILVICGAHGETDGSIAEKAEANSLRNLKVSLQSILLLLIKLSLNLNLHHRLLRSKK